MVSDPWCLASRPWPGFDFCFLNGCWWEASFHVLSAICRTLVKCLLKSSLSVFLLLSCDSLLCNPLTNPLLDIWFSSIFEGDRLHHGALETFHLPFGTTQAKAQSVVHLHLGRTSAIPTGTWRLRLAGPSPTHLPIPLRGCQHFLLTSPVLMMWGGFLLLPHLPEQSPLSYG